MGEQISSPVKVASSQVVESKTKVMVSPTRLTSMVRLAVRFGDGLGRDRHRQALHLVQVRG